MKKVNGVKKEEFETKVIEVDLPSEELLAEFLAALQACEGQDEAEDVIEEIYTTGVEAGIDAYQAEIRKTWAGVGRGGTKKKIH